MLNAWRYWCRLCAKENEKAIDIFVKNENNCNIVETLSKYFTISVNPLDDAPATICSTCFQFLTAIEKFAERVSKVEAMYSAIIFENINSIDYSSLKHQYGLNADDWYPSATANTTKQCDQSTDTADLAIEYLHIPAEIYDSEHRTSSGPRNSDVPCSLKKSISAEPADRTDPLTELLKIEQIFHDDKEESGDEVCLADYLQEDDVDDDDDTLVETVLESQSTTIAKLKCNKKRTKKLLKNDLEFSDIALFNCDLCNQKFKQKSSLRYHKRAYHPNEKITYACTTCSKKFPTEKRVKEHELTHLDPDLKQSYPCEYCEKKFSKQANLTTHIRTIHIGARPFICETCGKSFATKGALNEHKYTHMDATPFQCSSCPKKFKNQARLKTHEDTHIGTTYVCPNCGLILNTKRTLQMHMVVHSDQKKHKCNFCGNEFKRAKALKNHLILHSGLRPYNCPFCDKTFANGSNCRSHKKKSHPQELAAMEAAGKTFRATNIPKLEQLKSVYSPADKVPDFCVVTHARTELTQSFE